jgi:subtilisin family serine protease
VVAILVACSGVVLAQSTQPGSGQTAKGEELVADASSLNAGDPIPGSYIVVLDDSVSDPAAVADELVGSLSSEAEITQTYENALKGFAIRAPNLRLSDLSTAASAITGVDFVARDRAVKATAQKTPTGIDRIEADTSSTKAGNGSSSVDEDIAIIDTGIDKHPDLNIAGGHNCVGRNGSDYSDGNGHGTHVAGTAAAKDNGKGVVGVAPGARLWAVRVLNDNGSGSFSSVICGIDWVTGKAGTIEVANMSLGATVPGTDNGACGWTGDNASAAMHQAICNSVDAGVFYAVAAGNDSKDDLNGVPAAFDQVLTVTAMSDSDVEPGGTGGVPNCRSDNTDDTFATFSNYTNTAGSDDDHTIAAPGVCIRSTWKNGRYKTISGTSMASPHVTGTAALCIAHGDCTGSPANIMSKLRTDAQQRSDLTTTPYYGFTGDPNTAPAGPYYGYLVYAGGY